MYIYSGKFCGPSFFGLPKKQKRLIWIKGLVLISITNFNITVFWYLMHVSRCFGSYQLKSYYQGTLILLNIFDRKRFSFFFYQSEFTVQSLYFLNCRTRKEIRNDMIQNLVKELVQVQFLWVPIVRNPWLYRAYTHVNKKREKKKL